MRRLYRDTFLVIQKLRTKPKSGRGETGIKITPENYHKFSDSLDILNLTPEEVQMFVDPQGKNIELRNNWIAYQTFQTTETSFAQNKMIERFEEELTKSSGINPSILYEMISSLIEERINAEKGN